MRTRAASTLVALASFASVSLSGAGDASACGGVFVPASERVEQRDIVRDHRMAISISPKQTILWDQVRLQGDPAEFVWVSPVRPGSRVELANDDWFAALDASTQPLIYAPIDYNGAAGCALAGCAAEEARLDPGSTKVEVVREGLLGPYETVTVRAAGDPDAPYRWLVERGFAVPETAQGVLREYALQGFDFAALRLRAGCGARSMRPVRIITPGAEPRILVRMALAGARAELPITLFVVGETRYRAVTYDNVLLDDDELVWDERDERSNYVEVSDETLRRAGGRAFLTESASRAATSPADSVRGPTPGLYEAYERLCRGESPDGVTVTDRPPARPCVDDPDAGPDAGDEDGGGPDGGDADAGDLDAGDAAAPDAAAPDGGDVDAGVPDAGEPDAGGQAGRDAGAGPICGYGFDEDDMTLAVKDLPVGRIVVTRMRARLPASSVTADLELAPVPDEARVSNARQAARTSDFRDEPSPRSCASTRPRAPSATWALLAPAAFAASAAVRRARRRR